MLDEIRAFHYEFMIIPNQRTSIARLISDQKKLLGRLLISSVIRHIRKESQQTKIKRTLIICY